MGPTELWVLGTIVTIISGVILHLYKLISDVRSEMQQIGTAQMKDLWLSLNQLRQDIESDRRVAAEYRERVAGTMITKGDLNEQINRLIGEMDRRMNAAIQRRPPVRGQ